MRDFVFWQRWLVGVGATIAVFGVFMALFNGTALFDSFNRQIDPAFWGEQAVEGAAWRFQRWAYGVWGATVAGWGLTLTCIARYPFRRRERWARDTLLLAVAVWFALDTGISLAFGVHFNAVFNAVLLLVAAPPLVFTWREFARPGA